MRIKGHIKTGLCLGACIGFLMNHYHYDNKLMLITATASAIGAVAPDFMEMGIINHRTWTHWPLGWGLILIGCYFAVGQYPEYTQFHYGLGGFSIGALLHILADSPYYKGTPLFNPRKRFPTLQLEFDPRLNKFIEAVYMVMMVAITLWIAFGN